MPRFPSDDYDLFDTYEGYKLRGRFIERLQEGRRSGFYVEAEDKNGLSFEQRVFTPLGDTHWRPTDEVETAMMKRAVELVKERIDADDVVDGEAYEAPFRLVGDSL